MCICAAGFTGPDCGRLNYLQLILSSHNTIGNSINSTSTTTTSLISSTTSLMSSTTSSTPSDDTALNDITIGLIGGAIGAVILIFVLLIFATVIITSILVHKKRALVQKTAEFQVDNEKKQEN